MDDAMTNRSPKVSTAQRSTLCADAPSRSRPARSAICCSSTTGATPRCRPAFPGHQEDMKRTASAVLLALTLLLTGACGSQSGGGSNPDNQTDEVPGSDESRAPS